MICHRTVAVTVPEAETPDITVPEAERQDTTVPVAKTPGTESPGAVTRDGGRKPTNGSELILCVFLSFLCWGFSSLSDYMYVT